MTILAHGLVLWTGIVALVFVVLRTFTLLRARACRLSDRMGPANWDFSESWASTFTLVGALLGTILAQADVVPEPTLFLSNAAYGGLNLLFAVITVLAPLLYNTVRGIQDPPDDTAGQEPKEPQYQGFVWSFLLASAMTFWAVLGELGAMYFLFREIVAGGALSLSAPFLTGLFVITLALLLIYLWRGSYWIIRYQVYHATSRGAASPPPRTALTEARKAARATRLPPWPVL